MAMEDRAALELQDELRGVFARFEAGEMRAFGRNQEKVLQEFEEIAQMHEKMAQLQLEATKTGLLCVLVFNVILTRRF